MSDALIPLVSNPRGCFGSQVFIVQDAIAGVLSLFRFGETAFVLVEISPPCPNCLLTQVKEQSDFSSSSNSCEVETIHQHIHDHRSHSFKAIFRLKV